MHEHVHAVLAGSAEWVQISVDCYSLKNSKYSNKNTFAYIRPNIAVV